MISEDSSMEFDLFEEARRRLIEILTAEGRETLEAERIALHVIQGVRGVPKLLSVLNQPDAPADRTRGALDYVLANAAALDKARSMLRGSGSTDG